MRAVRAICAALVFVAVALPARAQSRAGWQMLSGDPPVAFPSPFTNHGDPAEYTFATIPSPTDPRWGPAPNGATIGFDIRSTLCGMGDNTCLREGVFTYFRSMMCVPDAAFRGTVQVQIGDVDDGARVTIFDASNPGGIEPGNPFAIIGSTPHTTDDFRALLDQGMNTIVLTQVDDCCMRSALAGVQILVNGMPLAPGLAAEVCNGLDDDCNGMVDDGLGFTSCGIGACARRSPVCVDGMMPPCVPGQPMPETCNNIDDDCNGTVDDGLGMTSCGIGACLNVVPNCAHGMPVTCMPGRPRPEVCNGIDDDCDGVIDNDCAETAPEPPPDVAMADATLDGCHDWRCDPALRLEGRAGPAGRCECGVVGALDRSGRGLSALWVTLLVLWGGRRVRALRVTRGNSAA